MKSLRKNKIYIDKEALASLALVQEGLLFPVDKLMNEKETQEVDRTKEYKNRTFPFSFILAPSGKKNQEVIKALKKGDKVALVENDKDVGEIEVEEVFTIDPLQRIKNIYGTDDISHPGIKKNLQRLGKYAVSGKFHVIFDDLKRTKELIAKKKKELKAKNVAAIMLAAKPLHRAHERLIRLTMENSDLVVLFLLKPYTEDRFSYELRKKCLEYFVSNYLPKNRVIIAPLENTYIFAGFNELILDAIVAQNFGCTKLVVGKNHAGLGLYYDKNSVKSVFDNIKGITIEIETVSEFVYCNECKTLVSTNTCPHGTHHHISYHADSILELLELGILPPAVLVRKEISAIILSELFPNRFKNLEKLFADLIPNPGLIVKHNEEDFYKELMKLYQTTSLT
ncbi:sulfate adenylyltransferase [Nitratiruptor sp. YY08-26]|uniref:sulfate adenylyltransferase n=1 Tax=unclassified Nitratiruptor TaxID=2624044 RepID=UPI00191598CC|nr:MULTISPECIES: sulfate adenylyltransferase [unclassified Nitratiruptor]BCD61832.1 sulfate adenylyltransferase [Nitratiruptor sp. YY08-13]BCD65767.1 sulfate adenylyltransferase [Nitratiruptor sp. YY08-26]